MARADIKKVAQEAVASKGSSGSSEGFSNPITSVISSITTAYKSYQEQLTTRLRLIDFFCTFLVALGVLQFVFVILVGNFPFNAFLGGFISTVGQFVLTISLRLQVVNQNKETFKQIGPERAVGDYIFASLMLHFLVYHFIN